MSADITYRALCGCKVRFVFDSGFRASKMTACPQRNKRDQVAVRDRIVQAAREWRDARTPFGPGVRP